MQFYPKVLRLLISLRLDELSPHAHLFHLSYGDFELFPCYCDEVFIDLEAKKDFIQAP